MHLGKALLRSHGIAEVARLRNPDIPLAFLGYWAYTAAKRQANEDLAPRAVPTGA